MAISSTVIVAPAAASGGSGGVTKESTIATASHAVVTFTNPASWFEEFDDGITGFVASSIGTGAAAASGLTGVQFTSGATAGGQYLIYRGNAAATSPVLVPGGASSEFYIEFRAKFSTAIDADSNTGILPVSAHLSCGALGATSTTNFVAVFSGGASPSITSSVALETASYHVIKLYRDGTTTTLDVDGTLNTSAAAYPSADCTFYLGAQNAGAVNTPRTVIFDYFYCEYERA